jgi:REP element-mobilizing transposase RayT
MAKPARNSDRRKIVVGTRTFFVTSKTSQGKRLLQSQRSAELFIDVLRSYTLAGRFKVHEFVVMPDHFHLLVSVDENTSIERAVQLIKGSYSFRGRENSALLERFGRGDFPRSGLLIARVSWRTSHTLTKTLSKLG